MTEKQVINIVEDYTNEKVSEVVKIINRGQVNDIYIADTDKGKYVLRVDPGESSINRFRKETWAMQAAHERDILVPEVFKTDLVIGHPSMLMQFVDGIDGDESPEIDFIWRKLGEYSREIQSVSTQGYGESMAEPGVFSDSWQRYVDYNISSLTDDDKAIQSGVITKSESAEIKKIFLELKNEDLNFGLIHHDLSLKNTIITKEGGVCLIDWGSAAISVVPHMEIAEILNSSLEDDSRQFSLYLEGYGMETAEYQKLKPQIRKLDLLAYMDKLRWAFDRKPDKVDHFSRKVKEKLSKI